MAFWCPGCDEPHAIPVKPADPGAGVWGWDENVDRPTFSPSLLVTGTTRCRTFVRAGQIEFLGDCTHALKGQVVAIPPWPSGYDED